MKIDRRTLLTRLAAGLGVISLAGFSIPFIRSLLPTRTYRQTLDVDLAGLRPGEAELVNWLGRQVFLVARPDDSYLVVYTNCTHLGCEVRLTREGNAFTGFECPCHQSSFDVMGRVEAGSAASRDLEVPDYIYTGSDTIRLLERIEQS